MKSLCVAALSLLVGCTRGSPGVGASSSTTSEVAPPKPAPVKEPRAFAVVELFSSEGCSSCPPAEALLGKLLAEARAEGKNVLFLGFHVDYWDRLGWKDPYSSAAYTQRQRRYAELWGQSGLYTPQAIVDGRVEMLGSTEAKVRAAIEASLASPSETTIELKVATGAESIDVDFVLDGAPADAVLDLALVERDLRDVPDRGENEGTTIDLENVVRAFETVSATKTGHAVVLVPPGVRRSHASLVAYVQRRADLVIVGGTSVDLP